MGDERKNVNKKDVRNQEKKLKAGEKKEGRLQKVKSRGKKERETEVKRRQRGLTDMNWGKRKKVLNHETSS